MARKYSKSASKDVERAMHKKKRGTLKSGSGKKVTNRKQAVAYRTFRGPQEGQEGSEEKGELIAPAHRRRAPRRMPTGPFSSKHGAQLMLRH